MSIHFYNPRDWDKIVYVVANGQIEKDKYRYVVEAAAEETTTPRGIADKIHVRGKELWTWGHQGNAPRKIETFETEEQAEHARLMCAEYDLQNSDNGPVVFDTRVEAEAFLAED